MADFFQPWKRRIKLRADALRTATGGVEKNCLDPGVGPGRDIHNIQQRSCSLSRRDWSDEYVERIAQYIIQHRIRSIVDVGVGDFHMGRSLLARLSQLHWEVTYTGVDAVESFIEVHMSAGHRPGVFFAYCDAVRDRLPKAELCLISQVLKHMSNSAVSTVLAKADRFAHVIVGESHAASCDFPVQGSAGNGRASQRNGKGSPVFPNMAPFNRKYRPLHTIAMRETSVPTESSEMLTVFIKDAQ